MLDWTTRKGVFHGKEVVFSGADHQQTTRSRNPFKLGSNHRRSQPEDWPDTITEQFACFKCDMTRTICKEIGQELYDNALSSCCDRLCLGKRKHAIKNPLVIQGILSEADRQGSSSESLIKIVSQIIALKERQSA